MDQVWLEHRTLRIVLVGKSAGNSAAVGFVVWGLLGGHVVWIGDKWHTRFRWGRWDGWGCGDIGRISDRWQLRTRTSFDDC